MNCGRPAAISRHDMLRRTTTGVVTLALGTTEANARLPEHGHRL